MRCEHLHNITYVQCRTLFLKNLLPLFPIPAPSRLDERCDLVSGLHVSSLRSENKDESAGEISLSFMLLHDTTLMLSSSSQCSITDSKPPDVKTEHPSKDRNLTLLQEQKDDQNPAEKTNEATLYFSEKLHFTFVM